MYLFQKELSIIETFCKNITNITEEDILTLVWRDGQIQAKFDTCFDDFNEENERDEFTSFIFKKLDLTGTPPVNITDADMFIINYHNFPTDIIFKGRKIN